MIEGLVKGHLASWKIKTRIKWKRKKKHKKQLYIVPFRQFGDKEIIQFFMMGQ